MIPLTLAQHNQLIELLVQYAPLHTEQERVNFLEAAGLSKFHAETRPGISKSDYCRELVRTLNHPATVMEDGNHGFPRFLRYVQQQVVSGHTDLVGFIDALFHSSAVTENGDRPSIYESRIPIPDLFVGRKKLLAEIWKRLRKANERNVLTLWGIGGVGKSAVALQVMMDDEAVTLFPNGRYWLDLRGGDAAAAIRGLLVRDFGMGDVQLPSALNEVVVLLHGQVRGKKVLLVMDNAESFATTPAEIRKGVREILLPLPGMSLVTSRVAIDPLHDVEVDVLETEEGVALLAQGLQWNKSARERESKDAKTLVDYLEGLALALRITASRMKQRKQTSAQALHALQKAPLLDIAAIEGDKTLRQTFALSYEGLPDALKTLFHFLGVCAVGGARIVALAEMLEWDEETIETAIDGLVERSLAERTTGRVELHPLLHHFALECAKAEQQYGVWMQTHAIYYGGKIGGGYQEAINNNQDILPALQIADASIENVRLAQIRLLDSFPNAHLAIEITDNLKQYWRLKNEGALLEWLQKAFVIAQKTKQTQKHANIIAAIGTILAFRKENDAALSKYGEALILYQTIGSTTGEANVLASIGDVHAFRKENDAAIKSYEEALILYKSVDSGIGQANVLKAIGDVHAFRNNNSAALKNYEEALTLFKVVGDRLGQATVLRTIGTVLAFLNDNDAALRSYEEALTLFKAVGSSLGQANVLAAIGSVQAFRKENDAALRSYEEALTLFKTVDDRLGQANVLQRIGSIQAFRKENDAALRSYEEALTLFKAVGSSLGQANVLQRIGSVQSSRGFHDAALRSYEEALTLFKAVGSNIGQANTLKAIGDAQAFRKERAVALESYQEALTLFNLVEDRLGQANVLAAQSHLLIIESKQEESDNLLEQAIQIYKDIGSRYGIPAEIGNRGWALLRHGKVEQAKLYLLQAADLFEEMGLLDYAEQHRKAEE